MIIGINFQRLYSPYVEIISQIIPTIEDHFVAMYQLRHTLVTKSEFPCSEHDEKVISTQREITLRLLELSSKEWIMKKKELRDKLHYENPPKFRDQNKTFTNCFIKFQHYYSS